MNVIFVYAKFDKIKVIGIAEQHTHASLIQDGYIHTATLDSCLFIENLVNEGKDVRKKLNLLKK